MTLEIKNLHVEIEGKEILKGINLTLEKGKIHALMGPNGSGKSTLANVIMGHPKYEITKGEILFNGENINELPPDERAKKGIFLSFQYPTEVSGVTISNSNKMMNPDKIILIITHYKRILELIKPDKLSILINGKIALEGDNNLVDQLEEKGYGWIEQD